MRFKNPFLHWIETIYNLFIQTGSHLQSLFLFYMRLTWGYQLFLIGWNTIHFPETIGGSFQGLQNSNPLFFAYFSSGWMTCLGGACVLLGFAARMAAIPLILILLNALNPTHSSGISMFKALFESASLAQQPSYPFLITACLIFIFGPGRISIDGYLKRWADKQLKY